jgi:hypothetical protein
MVPKNHRNDSASKGEASMSKDKAKDIMGFESAPVASEPEVTKETALALIEKEGKTRGKYSKDIKYKQLNRVPNTQKEFMDLVTTSEAEIVEYLYRGYNEVRYSEAADEIGEFLNDNWDKATQDSFRVTVRGMMKMTGLPVENVAALIKPSVEKAWSEKQAKLAAEPAKPEAAAVA